MAEPLPGRRPGGRQIIPRPERWRAGPQAPWPIDTQPTLAELVARVSPDSELAWAPDAQNSAVLVLLTETGDGPEVLLTRRSWEMRNHRGEISFPGGRMDPGETPTETALREAHEEVGLDPSLVTVHGELERISTLVSGSWIVPKVATVSERVPLSPQTGEVERVLWVPLTDLTRAGTHHTEHWDNRPAELVLHFFDLDDETVWGATARILVDLLGRSLR